MMRPSESQAAAMLRLFRRATGDSGKARMLACLAAGVVFLAWSTGAWADLTFPAVFEVVEESPSKFRLSLTVIQP